MGTGGGEQGGTVEIAATDVAAFRSLFMERLGGGPLAAIADQAARNYAGLRAKVLSDRFDIDRKDMPVITRRDVARLHHDLAKGRFDILPPYDRHLERLLPPGSASFVPTAQEIRASKRLAKLWAHSGDGAADRVSARFRCRRAGKMEPIQRQIYLDKVIDNLAEIADAHPRRTLAHLKRHFDNTTLVLSGDRQIIDGNHRWATMMVVDPRRRLNCLVVDLPLDTLLKVSLAFTGLVGNKPNA